MKTLDTPDKSMPGNSSVPSFTPSPLAETAWTSLDDQDQSWLGRDRFEKLCELRGIENMPVTKLCNALEIDENLGQPTWQFTRILRNEHVRRYIADIRSAAGIPWDEFFEAATPLAQERFLQALEGTESMSKRQLDAVRLVLSYTLGSPARRVTHEHNLGESARNALDMAQRDLLTALKALPPERPGDRGAPIIDTTARVVGSGEPATGAVERPGD